MEQFHAVSWLFLVGFVVSWKFRGVDQHGPEGLVSLIEAGWECEDHKFI